MSALRSAPPVLKIFLGIFLAALIFQTVIWSRTDIVDEVQWSAGIRGTSEHFLIHPGLGEPGYFSYGYPATPIYFGGALLVKLGIPMPVAFRAVLVFFISFAIALSVTLMYQLRPQSLWWIGGASVLFFTDNYYRSTPASSMVLPFIIAIVLLTFYAYEQRQSLKPIWVALFGFIIGLAFVIRLDISAAIAVASFLFLVPFLKEKAFHVGGYALLTCIALDPYLWFEPISHIAYMLERILFSYSTPNAWNGGDGVWSTSFSALLIRSPFAVLSVIFVFLYALLKRKESPMALACLMWLLSFSALIMGALFLSPMGFRPEWYFFPIFLVWIILFPLFLTTLAPALENRSPFSRIDATGRERLLLAFFMASQVIPFVVLLAPIG